MRRNATDANMCQNLVARNRLYSFLAPFQHLMQFPGVVRDKCIGEQRRRTTDLNELVLNERFLKELSDCVERTTKGVRQLVANQLTLTPEDLE